MTMQVPKGAWFPVVLAAIIMAVCMIWHSSYIKTLRFHNAHMRTLSSLLTPQDAESASKNPTVYRVSSSISQDLSVLLCLLILQAACQGAKPLQRSCS